MPKPKIRTWANELLQSVKTDEEILAEKVEYIPYAPNTGAITGSNTGSVSGSLTPQNIINLETLIALTEINQLNKSQFYIFKYILNNCSSSGDSYLIKKPLIVKDTGLPYENIKTSLFRLEKKRLILKQHAKHGMNGYSVFMINKHIKEAFKKYLEDKDIDKLNK